VITVEDADVDITLKSLTINVSNTSYIESCAFAITGNSTVNLTLEGDNILTSGYERAGIEMASTATLTIDGTDKDSLTATGGHNGAGIGGKKGDDNSGGDGENGADGGTVTINGGTVNANGTSDGTGIGGGLGGYSSSGTGGNGGSGGEITISGGTVNATGGIYGTGIGGGHGGGSGGSGGSGGTVTISGGTVNAKGGSFGAGIGGGRGSGTGGNGGNGGTISISGGTVIATGGYGAGIGGGFGSGFGSGAGIISISGGTVTAASVHYMDIGGYDSNINNSVTITGGSVSADQGGGIYSVNPAPTDGNGNNVYLNILQVGESPVAGARLYSGNIDGETMIPNADAFNGVYGIRDVVSDGSGLLYFWLRANDPGYVEVITTTLARYGKDFARGSGNNNTTTVLPFLGMYSFSSSSSCAAGAAGGLALFGAAGVVIMRRKRRREYRS